MGNQKKFTRTEMAGALTAPDITFAFGKQKSGLRIDWRYQLI